MRLRTKDARLQHRWRKDYRRKRARSVRDRGPIDWWRSDLWVGDILYMPEDYYGSANASSVRGTFYDFSRRRDLRQRRARGCAK